MSIFNSVMATVQFEISRVCTLQRLMVAIVMALFPPVMLFILQMSGGLAAPVFLISLFCGMVCLLSLLLWSTSNVYSELEGKSWTFITSRPHGRWSILFGKFLVAFAVSFVISWIALTLSMLITSEVDFFVIVSSESPPLSKASIWFYLSILLCLASMVYAAIFSLLGVLIQRRAMAFAVVYFVVVEIILALIPAIVGKFAMTFHMFCLLTHWVGWIGPVVDGEGEEVVMEFVGMYGRQDAWVHLAVIFAMTILTLSIAAYVIRNREYLTLEDAQI